MSKRWWEIFLVLAWLVLQSITPPTKHINHHDLDPPYPNLQHVGGMLFGHTRNTKFEFFIFCPALKEI